MQLPRLIATIMAALGFPALLLLAGSAGAAPNDAPPGEYAVKAAFIHNFAQFVAWPDDEGMAANRLNLCIVGLDPFGDALDAIRDKTVGGRYWEIRSVRAADDLTECRVAFVAASEMERLDGIRKKIAGRAVLTIGDSAGFAERGIMINFYLEERKVRFEINVAAVRQAGLTISSQVLKLAKIVSGDGYGDD
jgi:hypothetical protein